ncbi:hypothetical protein [Paraburkholderia ferrariae]|uniref:hypothetical protein n=1 Tax=Paraburkholderia ferrariae TaxID=386056 RepID=UPI00319E1A55
MRRTAKPCRAGLTEGRGGTDFKSSTLDGNRDDSLSWPAPLCKRPPFGVTPTGKMTMTEPTSDGRLPPPSTLRKRERDLWLAYVASHSPAWFVASDASALRMLVENEAAAEALRRQLKRDKTPTTVKARSGVECEHPEHRRLRMLEFHVLKQKKALRLVSQTSKRIDQVVKMEKAAARAAIPKPWLFNGYDDNGEPVYQTHEAWQAQQASYRHSNPTPAKPAKGRAKRV